MPLHYAKESHYCWYYFKGWLHDDSRNPFEVYKIEVQSYELVDLNYATSNKASAKMKLAYRYGDKKAEEFLATDIWEKIDGVWQLIDFNVHIDDNQQGPNYRVKPYEFNPDDFR